MRTLIITVLVFFTIIATDALNAGTAPLPPVHAAPVGAITPEQAKEFCGTSAKLAYVIIYYKHLGGTEAELRSDIEAASDSLGKYEPVITALITVYYGKQFDSTDFSVLFKDGALANFIKQFTSQCTSEVLGVEA